MENTKEFECTFCHEKFAIWDTRLVNRGIEGKEIRVCCSCTETACNNGKAIQCDACGELFTADVRHDEEICGHSFTACPACGKDVVERLTREEFEKEHRPYRYAMIMRSFNGGQRGYIVSMAGGVTDAIKKLAGKVNLDGAASITAAEILREEDEF